MAFSANRGRSHWQPGARGRNAWRLLQPTGTNRDIVCLVHKRPAAQESGLDRKEKGRPTIGPGRLFRIILALLHSLVF